MISTGKEFSDFFTISEVIYKLQGISVENGKSFICPFHKSSKNKSNSSINRDGKVFRCWTRGCGGDKGLTPYAYADYYCREVLKLNDWKEVKKYIDSVFNTNLYKEPRKDLKPKSKNVYDEVLKVDKYLSEVILDVIDNVKNNKTIVLNGGTGIGKTRALAVGLKENFNRLDVNRVVFVTPRSSIVEEISNRYNYDKFYKNDTVLPVSNFIVATTHKGKLLNNGLTDWKVNLNNKDNLEMIPEDYILVVDEAHLLMTNRNIVGNIKEIEQLISNSKYCIFTSANTYHFYKACKEQYNINKHISVQRKERIYNMESLDVLRIKGDIEQKKKVIIDLIKKEENKVFLIYNNIKVLEELEYELNKINIKAKSINANNKNNIDVIDSYNDLIIESTLRNNVTLCTSVVDTGVNIEQENITTIVIQESHQLDDITVIQAFARVRTTKGNKGILILSDVKELQEHHKLVKGFRGTLKLWESMCNQALINFNTHMMNNMYNYDIESVIEFKTLWNVLRKNDLYLPFQECLEVVYDEGNVNPRLEINKIVLYNKARKENIRNNYYCDDYILRILKAVNTKEIKINKIITATQKRKKSKGSFNIALKDVLENKSNVNDIAFIVLGKIDINNLNNNELVDFIKENKSKVNPIINRVKNLVKRCKNKSIEIDEYKFIKDYFNAYTEEKSSDRKIIIKKLEYGIFNKLWRVNEDYIGIGVLEYESIRRNCDCFLKNKNKPNKIAYMQMINEIYNNEDINRKAKLKGKEVNINLSKCKSKIDESIRIIYRCSDNLRLINLA